MSSPVDRRRARGIDKREQILDAAAALIGRIGYAAASTRAVATEADVPLSLVHYHFGSRGGLLAAVLERENARLLERQRALFAGEGTLAERWRKAAAFLDEDLDSGYVRMLWELWAAGLADPALAERWRASVMGWIELIDETITRWAETHDVALPLSTRTLANLVASVYQGELLATLGDLIESVEARATQPVG